MLGYEPPEPKLWKALLGAGIVVFPFLYIADVAVFHHRPGWIYLATAAAVTFFIGRQMYIKGPQGLKDIPIGVSMSKIFGGSSWQPPERHENTNTD